jgi:hypothetical protein
MLLAAISLVFKCHLLVRAAGKLDKIEAKFLELLTQLLSLLWVKSLALKLDRVRA